MQLQEQISYESRCAQSSSFISLFGSSSFDCRQFHWQPEDLKVVSLIKVLE